MPAAPATFPIHVARNAPTTVPFPRDASQLPSATMLSAGMGGKTFSSAAARAMTGYSTYNGSPQSQANNPLMRSAPDDRRRSDAGDSLATSDETHSLVRLALDAHLIGKDA